MEKRLPMGVPTHSSQKTFYYCQCMLTGKRKHAKDRSNNVKPDELDDPTSLFDQVYLGCIERAAQGKHQNRDGITEIVLIDDQLKCRCQTWRDKSQCHHRLELRHGSFGVCLVGRRFVFRGQVYDLLTHLNSWSSVLSCVSFMAALSVSRM